MPRPRAFLPLVALAALLAAAPASAESAMTNCRRQAPLICVISPTEGYSVRGHVFFTSTFREGRCKVRIRALVRGLFGPEHGFHVHTFGDLSNPNGTSTGGHFVDPYGGESPHGLPNDPMRHWGDFGNLKAYNGEARYNRVDEVIQLANLPGRGVTIHALEDLGADVQPTGGAGARIAYCVIGFASPESLHLLRD